MNANHTLADEVMDATADVLFNLSDRWNDESEYEDWNEYVEVVKKLVEPISGVEYISMTRQPFGFKWKGEDGFIRHTFLRDGAVETYRIKK